MSTAQAPEAWATSMLCLTKAPNPAKHNEAKAVDLVAVHGLDTQAISSRWTTEDGTLWLRDLLPKDIRCARVLAFNYNAKEIFTGPTTGTDRVAHNLLTALVSTRKDIPSTRPLVFLCHGLGGFVVEATVNYAFMHTSPFPEIGNCLKKIIFLSTPQRPSPESPWPILLVNCAKDSLYRWDAPGSLDIEVLKAVERNSKSLQKLTVDFRKQAIRIKVKILACYEQLPTPPQQRCSITETHASLALKAEKLRQMVGCDYQSMARFANREDENYKAIVSAVKKVLKSASQTTEPGETVNIVKGNSPPSTRPSAQAASIQQQQTFTVHHAVPGPSDIKPQRESLRPAATHPRSLSMSVIPGAAASLQSAPSAPLAKEGEFRKTERSQNPVSQPPKRPALPPSLSIQAPTRHLSLTGVGYSPKVAAVQSDITPDILKVRPASLYVHGTSSQSEPLPNRTRSELSQSTVVTASVSGPRPSSQIFTAYTPYTPASSAGTQTLISQNVTINAPIMSPEGPINPGFNKRNTFTSELSVRTTPIGQAAPYTHQPNPENHTDQARTGDGAKAYKPFRPLSLQPGHPQMPVLGDIPLIPGNIQQHIKSASVSSMPSELISGVSPPTSATSPGGPLPSILSSGPIARKSTPAQSRVSTPSHQRKRSPGPTTTRGLPTNPSPAAIHAPVRPSGPTTTKSFPLNPGPPGTYTPHRPPGPTATRSFPAPPSTSGIPSSGVQPLKPTGTRGASPSTIAPLNGRNQTRPQGPTATRSFPAPPSTSGIPSSGVQPLKPTGTRGASPSNIAPLNGRNQTRPQGPNARKSLPIQPGPVPLSLPSSNFPHPGPKTTRGIPVQLPTAGRPSGPIQTRPPAQTTTKTFPQRSGPPSAPPPSIQRPGPIISKPPPRHPIPGPPQAPAPVRPAGAVPKNPPPRHSMSGPPPSATRGLQARPPPLAKRPGPLDKLFGPSASSSPQTTRGLGPGGSRTSKPGLSGQSKPHDDPARKTPAKGPVTHTSPHADSSGSNMSWKHQYPHGSAPHGPHGHDQHSHGQHSHSHSHHPDHHGPYGHGHNHDQHSHDHDPNHHGPPHDQGWAGPGYYPWPYQPPLLLDPWDRPETEEENKPINPNPQNEHPTDPVSQGENKPTKPESQENKPTETGTVGNKPTDTRPPDTNQPIDPASQQSGNPEPQNNEQLTGPDPGYPPALQASGGYPRSLQEENLPTGLDQNNSLGGYPYYDDRSLPDQVHPTAAGQERNPVVFVNPSFHIETNMTNNQSQSQSQQMMNLHSDGSYRPENNPDKGFQYPGSHNNNPFAASAAHEYEHRTSIPRDPIQNSVPEQQPSSQDRDTPMDTDLHNHDLPGPGYGSQSQDWNFPARAGQPLETFNTGLRDQKSTPGQYTPQDKNLPTSTSTSQDQGGPPNTNQHMLEVQYQPYQDPHAPQQQTRNLNTDPQPAQHVEPHESNQQYEPAQYQYPAGGYTPYTQPPQYQSPPAQRTPLPSIPGHSGQGKNSLYYSDYQFPPSAATQAQQQQFPTTSNQPTTGKKSPPSGSGSALKVAAGVVAGAAIGGLATAGIMSALEDTHDTNTGAERSISNDNIQRDIPGYTQPGGDVSGAESGEWEFEPGSGQSSSVSVSDSDSEYEANQNEWAGHDGDAGDPVAYPQYDNNEYGQYDYSAYEQYSEGADDQVDDDAEDSGSPDDSDEDSQKGNTEDDTDEEEVGLGDDEQEYNGEQDIEGGAYPDYQYPAGSEDEEGSDSDAESQGGEESDHDEDDEAEEGAEYQTGYAYQGVHQGGDDADDGEEEDSDESSEEGGQEYNDSDDDDEEVQCQPQYFQPDYLAEYQAEPQPEYVQEYQQEYQYEEQADYGDYGGYEEEDEEEYI